MRKSFRRGANLRPSFGGERWGEKRPQRDSPGNHFTLGKGKQWGGQQQRKVAMEEENQNKKLFQKSSVGQRAAGQVVIKSTGMRKKR